MKQVLRMSKNQWPSVMDAVNVLTADLSDYQGIEYTVKSWKMVDGCIVLVAGENEFHTTIWTDGSDYAATPDWMLDWIASEWSGRTAQGNDVTIGDENEPIFVSI